MVIHEYVPDDTYLCGFQPTDLDAVRALPFVAWADVDFKGFKIAQSLRSNRLRPGVAVLADLNEVAVPGPRPSTSCCTRTSRWARTGYETGSRRRQVSALATYNPPATRYA